MSDDGDRKPAAVKSDCRIIDIPTVLIKQHGYKSGEIGPCFVQYGSMMFTAHNRGWAVVLGKSLARLFKKPGRSSDTTFDCGNCAFSTPSRQAMMLHFNTMEVDKQRNESVHLLFQLERPNI